MAAVYKTLSKGSNGAKAETPANGVKKNKQRVLIIPSRGITHRHRHLLNDLAAMLPHARKEAKFDSKKNSQYYQLNELAELYNCNNVVFFEARKGLDLYVWLSKPPNGPTVKLHLQNLHTLEELHFTGNCLKGSRPVLSFDSAFDGEPYLQVIKQLLIQAFGVPENAKKRKPFVDHVMGFTVADGKIWARNYEIKEKQDETGATKETDMSLVEIGPRFCMTPILIQEGAFGGPILYHNKEFVTPNQVRAELRKKQATKHTARAEQYVERLAKKDDLGLRTDGARKAPDALDTKQLFS
ncbi:Brix-domain-containing protein [Xylariomycetidae sp. FL0641]|nr:Brix-domain-containing protein [Xylariomycetidae sp. FL0641]